MDPSPIYSLRVPQVYQALESSPGGIPGEQAEERRSLYGSNLLSEEQPQSPWPRLFMHITHPLALLLWGAGGLAFAVGDFVLGVVIWILVLINACLSFWREHRAEEAMAALRRLLPSYARVIRDGEEVRIPASEVVPGDLLVLAEGDNIPADARVVEEYGLRINNANLTGEAVPARKTADASLREGISEVERPNLVFAGTSVVSGTGRAVVYATGMLTQFGRIAHLTQTVREQPSPLQLELLRLTRIISIVAVGIGAIVFTVGVLELENHLSLFEAFLLALGIIVAVIPEGLPATITLSLAMAVQRLAQRGVLVKKLAVVETLGTISIICTDKSGTLTQNQMTVRELWVSGQKLVVSGAGYEPQGRFSPDPAGQPFESDLLALLEAASLCNNARLNPPAPEHPQWTCLGDQTEAALKVAAIKGGLSEEALNRAFPRLHELPFDARRKRMSTIHEKQEAGEIKQHRRDWYPILSASQGASSDQALLSFTKGAPREVLQLCETILINGEVCPLTEELREQVLAANDDYARNARRVLALARHELPPRSGTFTVEGVERDLTFLGLMAMMDPPRPEVAEAVQTLRGAGIRMVMITGDYGLTAESLARRVGMLASNNPVILTGADLDQLNNIELQNTLQEEIIFARMAPEHKLRLVAAYQARGEVVAVTGDGVNDAPALRKADIGISMGMVGTDVAKEAADVIITNDNFATIVTAIEEGRAVYDNLRKFITYIFSSNVPEVLPFLITATFKVIPLALTVRQILAIDLGTDLFPALALGTEKPEPDVMLRPPRRRAQPLVDNRLVWRAFLWLGLIEGVLCFAGFFAVYGGAETLLLRLPFLKEIGFLSPLIFTALNIPQALRLATAITVFHAGVVMAQVGNAFACRTELHRGRSLGWLSNPFLLYGVVIEIAIILALIYIPPLAAAFDHAPLPPIFWLVLVLYAPALYGLEWLRKSIARRRANIRPKAEVVDPADRTANHRQPLN
jgi:magnesium-transporting ATPase (P-type)